MKYNIFFFVYKIIGIILCIQYWNIQSFWLWMSAYIIFYFVVVFIGSYYLKLNFFIKSISEGEEEGVMLTFDDGPHPTITPKLLEVLKNFNTKATFFIIGKEAEKYPEIVKAIHDHGHVIGNHSYSHSNLLPFYRKKKLRRDFEKTNDVLHDITGQKTKYIRPPFGVTSPSYTKMLRKTDLVSIGWTFRSFDTVAKNHQELLNKTISSISHKRNSILLFHDTKLITLEVLPDILTYIKEQNIKTVVPKI